MACVDAGVSCIFASSTLLGRLALPVHGIDPVRDSAAIDAATERRFGSVGEDSLAYIIYTSGSSGAPKGVEITHASLANLIRWQINTFRVSPRDRVSHYLGLAFDATVLEVWPHLCAGATLCLVEEDIRTSAELLAEWLRLEGITICLLPAIVGSRLMTKDWPTDTALRLLIVGGDTLLFGPKVGLPFAVVNNYGPTECTVVSTWALLEAGNQEVPPIGRPINNVCIYLLDSDRNPVVDGTVGEIFIGGVGVSRGYRNLPSLTEKQFLPDPFSKSEGALMFRTGDRGLRRREGNIVFCGRIDRQVKIRGYRVELDEVSTVLAMHPKIALATVTASRPATQEYELRAYVVPISEQELLTREELQSYLATRLPGYMIPDVFMRLTEIPLNLNGKIDFDQLPEPTRENIISTTSSDDMGFDPIEQQLLSLLTSTLNAKSQLSSLDNFFLAGGHSLMSFQVLTQIRTLFKVTLSLKELLDSPTARQLAQVIKLRQQEGRLSEIWTQVLGHNNFHSDSDIFDVGLSSDLLTDLQDRITSQIGCTLSASELLQNPTLKSQAALLQKKAIADLPFPSGLTAFRRYGTKLPIYWIHILSLSLAREMDRDRPFIS